MQTRKKYVFNNENTPKENVINHEFLPHSDIFFGTPTFSGQKKKIVHDIPDGCTVRVYGWHLILLGSVGENVNFLFDKNFIGGDENHLHVNGNIGANSSIKDVFRLHVNGDIHNDVVIEAESYVIVDKNVGDSVKIISQLGSIRTGDVGEDARIESRQGHLVTCGNVGANTKIRCPLQINALDVEASANLRASKVNVSHITNEKPSGCFHSLFKRHPKYEVHTDKSTSYAQNKK